MSKTYQHSLFIAPIYDQDQNLIEHLIYDDSKTNTDPHARELQFHQHQTILRKKHLSELVLFKMINDHRPTYQNEHSQRPYRQKHPNYYEFGQFIQAVKYAQHHGGLK